MSEEKPKPQPKNCKAHCACAEKAKKKKGPQNGKGDSPRNMSSQFRDNYSEIKWAPQPEKA